MSATTFLSQFDLFEDLERRQRAARASGQADMLARALVDQVVAAAMFLELAAQATERETGDDKTATVLRVLARSADLADAARQAARASTDQLTDAAVGS